MVVSLKDFPLDVIELPDGKLLHPFPSDDSWETFEFLYTDIDCKKEFELVERRRLSLYEFC